jgi:hypothetical protein
VLDAFPGLSAEEQAAALQAGALDLGASGADTDSGYGRLDLFSTYRWLSQRPPPAEPSNLLFLPLLVQ